jgi:hypothetical protein
MLKLNVDAIKQLTNDESRLPQGGSSVTTVKITFW